MLNDLEHVDRLCQFVFVGKSICVTGQRCDVFGFGQLRRLLFDCLNRVLTEGIGWIRGKEDIQGAVIPPKGRKLGEFTVVRLGEGIDLFLNILSKL